MTTIISSGTPTGSEPAIPTPGRSEPRSAWLMVAPAFGLLVLFTYLPAVLSLVASLFDVPLTGRDWTFVGLGNYADNLSDSEFWRLCGTRSSTP